MSLDVLLQQIEVAEEASIGAREASRYHVEIPFRAARNGRLTQAPYVLPDGVRVEQTVLTDDTSRDERRTVLETIRQTFGSDRSPLESETLADPERIIYRYCITLPATNAEEAITLAAAGAIALLDAFAANQMAFELGPTKDRYIKRLDPPSDPAQTPICHSTA